MNDDQNPRLPKNAHMVRGVTAATAVAGVAAAIVAASAHRTERTHPPAGRFLDVSGTRVHYLEEGSGPVLVLIHGNAMSSEDFIASDLVRPLAQQHRVIVFDRPGFGYTERPRDTAWTPQLQADLIYAALEKLGVVDPIVVGHSLGSLVTVALAIAHPAYPRALVLLSGFYYPAMPLGLPVFTVPAMPVADDVMRFTLAPVLARIMKPALTQQMFAPAPVSPSFARYPLSMARRPSQIRATIEDAKFMNPAAKTLSGHYGELTLPIEILAGDGDMVVNTWGQSERLAQALPNARFDTVEGAGHMIHYIAPERVLAAIAAVEERSQSATPIPEVA
ncbi:MAG: alpha/beta hydrolase [Candidatus Eremiobacteraeota bacterium]|nr:alpha/beta hydrolase [Candidatus Eremiobacteraeota bacterium]